MPEWILGKFSWMECVNGGYAFLCSSDKGAYIVDTSTGEVILTISQASTLYTFDAPEGQPYFTALYLSDNGETRLDVYSREEPSSRSPESKAVLHERKGRGADLRRCGYYLRSTVPFHG